MQSKEETRKFRITYVLLCTGAVGVENSRSAYGDGKMLDQKRLPGRDDGKDDSDNS